MQVASQRSRFLRIVSRQSSGAAQGETGAFQGPAVAVGDLCCNRARVAGEQSGWRIAISQAGGL